VTLQSLVEEGKVMARARAAIIVVGAVLIIAGLAVFKACRDPGNAIPEKEQHTIDSLKAAKPGFNRTADSIRAVVVTDTVRSVVYRTKVERVLVAAATDRTLADSLSRLASIATTAADSATRYHAALDVRTREADSLRLAVVFADSAWKSERAAVAGLQILYGADTLRRVAVEQLNARLVADVKTAGQCRVLRVMACPSRGVAFLGGAVLAGAGVYVIARNP
jgi:hypothetical protein